jgi:hypothetical protein
MIGVTNIKGLYDFVGHVALYAPANFPEENSSSPGGKMELETAFNRLHDSVTYLEQPYSLEKVSGRLFGILNQSLFLYESGHPDGAVFLLQEFQDAISSYF